MTATKRTRSCLIFTAGILATACIAHAGPVISETWTGADTTGWPGWSVVDLDGNVTPDMVIHRLSNQGRVHVPAGGMGDTRAQYMDGVQALNVDLSVTARMNSNGQRFGLVARLSDANPDTFYWLALNDISSTLELRRVIDGSVTVIPGGSLSLDVLAATDYRLQLRVDQTATGTRLRAQAWELAQSEPGWLLDVVDNTLALQNILGRVGVAQTVTSNRFILYDNFQAVLPEPASAGILLLASLGARRRKPTHV